VALMFAANPRLTAAEAREVLCATAERVRPEEALYDAAGWSPTFGCGRVDAGAAVELVANLPPGAPTPLGPAAPAEGSVVLRWAAGDDPDADPLGARLRWSADGGDEVVVELPAGATELSLTGAVAAGQAVTWAVASVDAWGPGPEAEGAPFTVALAEPADTGAGEDEPLPDSGAPDGGGPDGASPEPGGEKGGCAVAPGPRGGLAGLVLAAGLISRRRRRPAAG
jgi:MYXO-CTERM domain-containing protein